MTGPIRITAALDKDTAELLEKESKEASLSQSEVIRRALRFYHENKSITDVYLQKKIYTYMDMLLSGEHVILDVSHLLLFLSLIESSPMKERFWKDCREVARSHAEQFKSKVLTPKEFLERLEVCNFFRMNIESENEFTLILFSETSKEFVKTLLEEVFKTMGSQTEIKLDLAKIRIKVSEPIRPNPAKPFVSSTSRFYTDKPSL
ncbi:MAG: ribbon-helix-helix protein, CopG family [Thaumarchaeota archaeon]|nr:ribbon-helix-helix protein, CopG family [Nitrososphaerota archaeon]MCL5319036.1 ribbon-helix-helix protein, CopG family [Nitrososphaerota archaeon]